MVKKQRSTVYNTFFSEEKWKEVEPRNRKLVKDFLGYLKATDRSPQTIYQYAAKLSVFFLWNLDENNNKLFWEIRKREFVKFLGYGRTDLGWSTSHVAGHKSVLGSLSRYVENYLDDEYPMFRNVIPSLEPIHIEKVREKTVVTMEQVEEALAKLTEQREYQLACYLALLVSSGIRKSEILQMRVDFFTDENLVFDIMYKTPKIRTKGRGVKGKQVPRYVFKYEFDPYLKAWLEDRKTSGIDLPELFVDYRGGHWVPANITTANKWAKRLGDLMGVDGYSHMFRHCYVTKLKQGKYPDDVITALMSWASSDMVKIYNDTSEEQELLSFFNEKKELKDE